MSRLSAGSDDSLGDQNPLVRRINALGALRSV